MKKTLVSIRKRCDLFYFVFKECGALKDVLLMLWMEFVINCKWWRLSVVNCDGLK